MIRLRLAELDHRRDALRRDLEDGFPQRRDAGLPVAAGATGGG